MNKNEPNHFEFDTEFICENSAHQKQIDAQLQAENYWNTERFLNDGSSLHALQSS